MAKILLIEDDHSVADKIQLKLPLDHITPVTTLRSGLKALTQGQYDYVLVDVSDKNKKEIDQIFTAIRNFNQTIPITILTDDEINNVTKITKELVGVSIIPKSSVNHSAEFSTTVHTASYRASQLIEKHEEIKKVQSNNEQLEMESKALQWRIEVQGRKLKLIERISMAILILIVLLVILEIIARHYFGIETLIFQSGMLALVGALTVVIRQSFRICSITR